ncbi:protein phosphatase 1G [Protopterus annectens]|uniref:protein phosphatase 1G n=1 Tax=Protopterus annectens TaxID=7888 RepID=UPI001CFBAC61|nr:protein phosphatase 1G [Protopterus annectens]
MGAYLSQPNTVKTSFEGGNETLSYAVSAMQGWRVSMEDAHSCIPDLDEETALFAVYDGHGGEEVALYCAKYLPSIIKEQKAYKDGRLQKALEDAFLAIDAKLTTEPVIKELCQIAGRGQDDDDDERERVADEDDGESGISGMGSRYGWGGKVLIRVQFFLFQECSEEEGECSSEETDEEEDDEDSEDAEEEEEEEEEEGGEMMLPGMDGKEEPGSDSGTTAVVALLCGTHLIVANAGDSRCVVAGGGKAVNMYAHKPEDEMELNRTKNAGGKVTMDGRVNGGLNLSRAIGDHFYKRNKNLPPEEQMISALPDVKVLALKPEHEFMVIACDGIWNVMTSQEVIDFVQERINKEDENGELRSLTSIVEELLDQCLAPDTSGDGTGCDNMTCIIVTFQPRPLSSQQDCNKRKLEEDPVEDSGRNSGKKFKP